MAKLKYSLEEVEKWAKMYEECKSFKKVADYFGVSKETIRRRLTKDNSKMVEKYSLKEMQEWAYKFNECFSFIEVGKYFNIGNRIIIKQLNEYKDKLDINLNYKKCEGSDKYSCEQIKPIDEFPFRSSNSTLRRRQCKDCLYKRSADYDKRNKDKISARRKKRREDNIEEYLVREKEGRKRNKKQRAEYNKRYAATHQEEAKAYRKDYNKKNKEKISQKNKKRYKDAGEARKAKERERYHRNKKHIRELRRKRHKERMESDPIYRLKHQVRGRLSYVIKNKTMVSLKYIGCTIEYLKEYLESKFFPHPKTGEKMTWKNHKFDGWHIDHIVPLATIKNIDDDEQIRKVCHYTNLQPLWAEDNFSKGAKLDWEE